MLNKEKNIQELITKNVENLELNGEIRKYQDLDEKNRNDIQNLIKKCNHLEENNTLLNKELENSKNDTNKLQNLNKDYEIKIKEFENKNNLKNKMDLELIKKNEECMELKNELENIKDLNKKNKINEENLIKKLKEFEENIIILNQELLNSKNDVNKFHDLNKDIENKKNSVHKLEECLLEGQKKYNLLKENYEVLNIENRSIKENYENKLTLQQKNSEKILKEFQEKLKSLMTTRMILKSQILDLEEDKKILRKENFDQNSNIKRYEGMYEQLKINNEKLEEQNKNFQDQVYFIEINFNYNFSNNKYLKKNNTFLRFIL